MAHPVVTARPTGAIAAPAAARSRRPFSAVAGMLAAAVRSRTGQVILTFSWGVLLALTSARRRHLYPVLGVDPSYYAAIGWTSQQGVLHGRDIVFTYGPLGWLQGSYDFDPQRGALSASFALAVLVVACVTVVAALARQGIRLWVAAPIALVAGAVLGSMQSAELAAVAVFGIGLLLVAERPLPTRWAAAYAGLFGAAVPLVVFIKTDTGVRLATGVPILLALCLKAPDATPRFRRGAVVAAVGTVAGLAVVVCVWAEEGFENFGPYVRGGYEVAAGFAGAMGMESNPGWEYAAAAVLVVAVVVLGQRAVRRDATAVRACVAAGLLSFSWVIFKSGFVRHDAHSHNFFAAMVIVLVILVPARVHAATRGVGVGLLSGAFALSLVSAGTTDPLPVLIDPAAAKASLADTHGAIRDHVRPRPENWITRNQIIGLVPPAVVAAVGNGSVHVEPDQTAFAWAIVSERGGRWDPIPTIQAYSGYTPYLDDLNARFIASPDAPDVVLYRRADGDWDQAWQSPAYKAALFCHYEATIVEGDWRVLVRRPASICAAPRAAKTQTSSRSGGDGSAHVVDVPAVADDELLLATFAGGPIDSTPHVLEIALKPPPISVVADPREPEPRSFPFVGAVARQAHVVAFPRCWRTGDRVDPRDPRQLGFTGGFDADGQPPMTATFSTVKVQCPTPVGP